MLSYTVPGRDHPMCAVHPKWRLRFDGPCVVRVRAQMLVHDGPEGATMRRASACNRAATFIIKRHVVLMS